MKVVILAGEWVRGSARRHPPGQSPWSKLGGADPPVFSSSNIEKIRDSKSEHSTLHRSNKSLVKFDIKHRRFSPPRS